MILTEKFETIIVERPDVAIARIVMNRPEARNAQNLQMTYDLSAAFDAAVQDDTVKIIILACNGPHFFSGHDLRPRRQERGGRGFSIRRKLGRFCGAQCPRADSPGSRRSASHKALTADRE